MTTLILAGEVIVAAVAGAVTFDAANSTWITPDGRFPAAAGITGTANVNSLPADFAPHLYVWRDAALDRLPDPDPPPAPVPAEVTNFQARAALLAADLFETVDAAIRGGGDPLAVQAWDYANVITRRGALVTAMAGQLGLTDGQLDDLFRAAAVIEA
ncbi:hypothetical protein UFOVP452_39 [uncultured Caudovirales phage]|uniref:Uncharacterized protein n=1 Tax=uncultured Caudovirales phage TaxID=2100421 RepID=A0A6J5MGB5_9CAUD|nr:hypothetical protein UFOVP452_39 [uncultured Caudovirales phage]